MNALAASTPPLDMNKRGMIYITKIMGYTAKSGLRNIVLEQYRWDAGAKVSGYLPASQVWQCGSWSNGTCTNIAKADKCPRSVTDVGPAVRWRTDLCRGDFL